MRYRELYEAPIDDWSIDPNFDANRQHLRNVRTSYERDVDHYDDSDVHAIKNEKTIERVKNSFLRVPFNFNFYFFQANDSNYDKYLDRGIVDDVWIQKHMGDAALDYVKKTRTPDSILIIFTGNLADDFKINMKSAWTYAHRISHTLVHGQSHSDIGFDIENLFLDTIRKVVTNAYGVKYPRNDGSSFSHIMTQEYNQTYMKILFQKLGTMNSARKGLIANPYDWMHETFAQYLLTGKVTLNDLPEQIHPDEVLTTDPVKLKRAEKALSDFQRKVTKLFDKILEDSKGKVIVQ